MEKKYDQFEPLATTFVKP